MSLVIEEIAKRAEQIPIILDGKEKKMGDLEGDRVYEATMKSAETLGRIYFGEKTRQGISIHLFHMGIVDKKSLELFGYEIFVNSLGEGAR